MRGGVKIGVPALRCIQWVDIGNEVPAHAKSVDELPDPGLSVNLVIAPNGNVLRPTDRLVWNAKCAEDLVVKVVFAKQKCVNSFQELTRLSTLDDAVVVCRREGHHL